MASDNPVIGTETCMSRGDRCNRIVEIRVNVNGRCYYFCDGAASEDGEGCGDHHRFSPHDSREMKIECGYPPGLRGGAKNGAKE